MCGGLLILILVALILAESANLLRAVFIERAHTYSVNEVFHCDTDLEDFNITLGKHNNSANFIFGLFAFADAFDIQNNPYVEVMGARYSLQENGTG